ncbi:hypothetical protein LTR56_001045 [Elasticomyces elasticus]|nr:hypothetical protein LTR56_001045 [Elasticomyces elasticus]KAK3663446.1 hypothetical protein LTR22_005617 [Elasticomyces elasticus]KAK5768967.1 hypothetical protein LTS12_000680 [Elasticomyces elasticus]
MASNQQPSGGLDLDNVQGDILLDGLAKKNETFFFFKINDAKSFCQKVKQAADEITHTLHSASARDNIANNSGNGIVPTVGANIAFSFQGLQKMSQVLANLPLQTQDPAFEAGMKAAAASLHDPVKSGSSDPAWESSYLAPQNIHGLILVAGSDDATVQQKLQKLMGVFGSSMSEVHRVSGKVRPGENKGHEHFGFLDGVSEPAVDDVNPAGTVPPGQDTIPQGVILCGRPGDRFSRPAWMVDGSFLCFRKLQQNVQDWNKFLVDASNQLGTWPDQLGSRLIGRWKSGCPVSSSPDFDDKNLAADPNRINNFDFDADQFRCPMGAHIRKMNPRGDLGRSTVNRFRVLRRGIPYGDEVNDNPSGERGLLFVCYQANISSGFAFLQQSWANMADFFQPGSGLDAVMGQSNTEKSVDMKGLYPQDAERPLALSGINRFVVPKGGEYFFTPSMTALKTTLSTVQ